MFEYATFDSFTIGPTVDEPSFDRARYTFASPSVSPIFSSSYVSFIDELFVLCIKMFLLYTLCGGGGCYKGGFCWNVRRK